MSLASPRHQRAHGRAELHVAQTPRGPELRHLFQAAPLRILFPRPEPGEWPQPALVNVGGGLAGGDRLEMVARIEAGAAATLTTPAAEKLYRSLGEPSRIDTELHLEDGATLEWLPRETILFDGARLQRRMRAHLAPGARLLAAEMLVFGRAARDEAMTQGSLLDSWRLWRGGRLHWADATAFDDPATALARPFGFGGAGASALLLLAGSEAEARAARDILREQGHAATLARPGLMLARWTGAATPVREALCAALPALRAGVLGRPPRLPRLWTT
ncbi:urease accessory protein UreD [Roseomonas sp. GC11]|uniref:urease accessory protein UreD n=1 Tax=Roseomonas sp. GC11 TaxID=2950546 RepID=UPI00210C18E7|nr:urease accessory protein UreD [Roseomonas sp. GC11]MCQ4160890.1 urease accessory protein UreD [Roseomonas sp. GC11]